MDKILHTATGMDMRFDKELAAAVPGWESEFGNAPALGKATTPSPIAPESLPPSLCELLREFPTAMVVTHHAEGYLRGRPMIVLEVEASGRLWFIASAESALVHEISEETQVHLTFQKDHVAYISLNGRAALVHDRAKVEQLWNAAFDPWFPGGKNHPLIALISVTPQNAEYWVHRLPAVSGSWDAKLAYVHGTKPESERERPNSSF